MTVTPQTIEQFEIDRETAHGNFVGGFLDPTVSPDAKIVAAAIALAGSEIALAIVGTLNGSSKS